MHRDNLLVLFIIFAVDKMFQLSEIGQCVVLDAHELVVPTCSIRQRRRH